MRRIILVIYILIPLSVVSQESRWEEFLYDCTTDEELSSEPEWESHIDELQALHQHPLDLNTATVQELLRIPFLDEAQIEQIHAYIYLHGAMLTVAELRLIPYLSAVTRRFLPLFVIVRPVEHEPCPSAKKLSPSATARWYSSIPLYYRKGDMDENGYMGDPLVHRMLTTARLGNIGQVSVRMEKDAGERYFDSYGAAAQWEGRGVFQRVIAGDYRVSFGEGLVLGGGSQIHPGSLITHPSTGIRVMTSMDEVNYLRGAATTLALNHRLQWTLLTSLRRMDATLDNEGNARTLQTSGYHRTQAEDDRRGNITQRFVATHLQWQQGGWKVGGTAAWQNYSKAWQPSDAEYCRWNARGKNFGNMSVDYGWNRYRFSVAGETAYSTCYGGWGTLHRIRWQPTSRMSIGLHQRFYSYRYLTFQGSAMCQNSTPQNESGYTLRAEGTPWTGWETQGYVDVFYNPWARYRVSHSSHGMELMGQIIRRYGTTDRGGSIRVRYQWKRREANESMQSHHRIRMGWICQPMAVWQFGTMAQTHLLDGAEGLSVGYSVGETIRAKWEKEGFLFTMGTTYFHTDDWESRIYLNETGGWNALHSVALGGKGIRGLLTLRWEAPSRHWWLQGGWTMTEYFDRSSQSSGMQTIYSSRKHDLTVQCGMRY